MKHLKIYEEMFSQKLLKKTLDIIGVRFNNGDYVKIKKSADLYKEIPSVRANMIEKDAIYEIEMIDSSDGTYLLKNLTTKNIPDVWISDKDLRRATEVEISALKYNL